MPTYREPGRTDIYLKTDPTIVISDNEFTALLAPILVGSADADEEHAREVAFERLYTLMYASDIAHVEAYKEYRRDVNGLKESKPRLMRYIIDTIDPEPMEMLRANPLFVLALERVDILGVVREAEVVLGLQGQFSLVATETAYDKLTQAGPPALSWSAYTNRDSDLRLQLASLNQHVNANSATIRYLTRLVSIPGEWDNKVAQLLSRVPLPTVAESVVELQAQINLTRALQSARGKPTVEKARQIAPPVPNIAISDTPVMSFAKKEPEWKKDKQTARTKHCSYCGKDGHTMNECYKRLKQSSNTSNISNMNSFRK